MKEKAMADATYVLIRFTQSLKRLESRDARPWKEVVRLTAKNKHGCNVGLFKT